MKTLEAGGTAAIDIRKLRDEQIGDVNGHRLPPRITAGQINWRTRNGEPRLIGRVNTMSVSKAPVPSHNICVNVTQAFQAILNNTTYPIQTTTTRADCVQGSTITISGNPTAFNKTFSQGNTTPN